MVKVRYAKDIPENLRKIAAPSSLGRSSLGREKDVGEYFYLPTHNLISFHGQVRKRFSQEEIDHLADSIKTHGVRQPLTVIRSPERADKYEVVSGERRLRASIVAGVTRVPCIIIEDMAKAEEIALVENIQRQDLHPVELALGIKNLVGKIERGDQGNIAKNLGMTQSKLSNYLKLAQLPQEVLSKLSQKINPSRDLIRKLIKSSNIDEMRRILGIVSEEDRKCLSGSILRINFDKGAYFAQASKIKELDMTQKRELADFIRTILASLEEEIKSR